MKKKKLPGLMKMCLACLSLMLCLPVSAKTIYVKPDAASTAWDGQTDVFTDIKAAYDAATPEDEVWIAAGEYPVSPNIGLKSVKIYGGFAGNETSVDQRIKTAGGKAWEYENASILKLSAGGNMFSGYPAMTFLIDGVTLDGDNKGRAFNIAGHSSSLKADIINCIIQNFNSGGDGGAFNVRSGGITIAYCLIQNNKGNKGGGGYFDRTIIHDCHVMNNSVPTNQTSYKGSTAGGGGGLFLVAPSVAYNCHIENNTASFGGGVFMRTEALLYNSIVVDNTSQVSGSGISFDARNSGTYVYNCIIANNQSNMNGGAGVSFTGEAAAKTQYLRNSVLYNNQDNESNVVNIGVGTGTVAPVISNNILDKEYDAPLAGTSNIIETNSSKLFRDIDSGNYMPPLAGFAGINKGDAAGLTFAADADYIGGPRTQAGTIDIGPYELISIGAITGGEGVKNATATLNGTPTTGNFDALYGDVLVITFTKTDPDTDAACSAVGAQIVEEGAVCTATIVIAHPEASVVVSAGRDREVTVNLPEDAADIQASIPGSSPYMVANGGTLEITFNYNRKGYSISADAGLLTGSHAEGYKLTIVAIADMEINVTEIPDTYNVTAVKNDAVTWTEAPAATAVFGQPYTFSFTIPEGYHLPIVLINGQKAEVTGSGPYVVDVEVAGIAANMTITAGAYPKNVLPVSEDTYQRFNGTGSQDPKSGEYAGYGTLQTRKNFAAIPLFKFVPTEAMKTAGYNKVELRLVPADTRTNFAFTVRQFPDIYETIHDVPQNKAGDMSKGEVIGGAEQPVSFTTGEPFVLDVTGDYILNFPEEIKLALLNTNDALGNIHSLENQVSPDYVPQLVFIKTGGGVFVDETIASDPVVSTKYYTLQGIEIAQPAAGGMCIVKTTHESGKTTSKVIYQK